MAWQRVYPDPHNIDKERNRIAKMVQQLSTKDPARLGTELDQVDLRSLSSEEKELWFRVRGTVEFRTGNRQKAIEFYQQGLEAFPTSPVLLFSCAQEYESRGLFEQAKPLFLRVDLREAGSQYTLEIARYLYLWNFLKEAQSAIQWIFDAYYEQGIADDNYLHMRNLPFYSVSFGHRATYAVLLGRPHDAVSELERSKRDLDDLDIGAVEPALKSSISGDRTPLLKHLTDRLSTEDSRSGMGYLALMKAVHESRMARSPSEADATLDKVSLTSLDFQWLEDVRLLAKCEVAHRFRNRPEEARLSETFFLKQARLFEPDHAFTFGFMRRLFEIPPASRAREIGTMSRRM